MNVLTNINERAKETASVYIEVGNMVYCIRETDRNDGIIVNSVSNKDNITISPRTKNSIEIR